MSTPHSLPISEQAKQLLIRWFEEVWNQSRRETIFHLIAPGAVIHDGANERRGPEEFARFYDDLRAQFSDFRITPVVALAEGNLACLHWSASFRHTATGKPVKITGTSVVRVEEGRFVEGWQNWDAASLAAQLAA
jgi:predicted SnoaL-like aldol condensation-catalyzing enzyme